MAVMRILSGKLSGATDLQNMGFVGLASELLVQRVRLVKLIGDFGKVKILNVQREVGYV